MLASFPDPLLPHSQTLSGSIFSYLVHLLASCFCPLTMGIVTLNQPDVHCAMYGFSYHSNTGGYMVTMVRYSLASFPGQQG